jgi:hypothetical protein
VPFTKIRMYASEIFNINWSLVDQADYTKLLQLVFEGKVSAEFVSVPLFRVDADNIRMALNVSCLNQ